MNLRQLTFAAFLPTALFILSGCTTPLVSEGDTKEALVCPQCRMVKVTVKRPHSRAFGRGYYGSRTTTALAHTCPSCQGVMATLWKEGQLKHKCSICKDGAFICPVFHPTNR